MTEEFVGAAIRPEDGVFALADMAAGEIRGAFEAGAKEGVHPLGRNRDSDGTAAEVAEKFAVDRVVRGTAVEDPVIAADRILQPVIHGKCDPVVETPGVVGHALLQVVRVDAFGPPIALLLLEPPSAILQPGGVEIETGMSRPGVPPGRKEFAADEPDDSG